MLLMIQELSSIIKKATFEWLFYCHHHGHYSRHLLSACDNATGVRICAVSLGSFRIPNGVFHASGYLNIPEWLHDLDTIKEQITIL